MTSVGLANEVNVFVFDPLFVARVARLFEADLTKCREVTHASIDARPVLEQAVDQLANDALNLMEIAVGVPSQ